MRDPIEKPEPVQHTPLTRAVFAALWLLAIGAMSGPIVMFVQGLTWVATGQYPDWRVWGYPLGLVLLAGAVSIGVLGAMAGRVLERVTKRR